MPLTQPPMPKPFVQRVLVQVKPTHIRDRLRELAARELKAYADWRVGATCAEMRAHKTSDTILLTFDDGGTPQQIHDLLRILRREQVKAMFFPRGDWALNNTALLNDIARGGHIVGNHSYSHPDLLRLGDEQVRAELARGLTSIWVRPPRGRFNHRIRRIAAELGMAIVYWSIDSDDWKGVSARYMSRKILRQLHPGAVILFHMDAPHTAELLPGLIKDIRRRGFTLCTFDEPSWEPTV